MKLKHFIWGLMATLVFSFAFALNLQHKSSTEASKLTIINAQALAQVDQEMVLEDCGGDYVVTKKCDKGQIACSSGGCEACDIEKHCPRP